MTGALDVAGSPFPAPPPAWPSVLLVDDHPLFREALAGLIERGCDEPLEIAHADSAEAALRVAARHPRITLVVLDLHLPGTDGAEAITAIRRELPGATVVVVSGSDARHEIQGAIRAGAQAFISKAVPPQVIATMLRRALRGRLQSPAIVTPMNRDIEELPEAGVEALTDRQREVLRLIGKGHPNKEIALRLGLAEITIKQHVSRILTRLGVSNRTQAAITARRMALVDPSGELSGFTAEPSV